jgi:hypothetical protein
MLHDRTLLLSVSLHRLANVVSASLSAGIQVVQHDVKTGSSWSLERPAVLHLKTHDLVTVQWYSGCTTAPIDQSFSSPLGASACGMRVHHPMAKLAVLVTNMVTWCPVVLDHTYLNIYRYVT